MIKFIQEGMFHALILSLLYGESRYLLLVVRGYLPKNIILLLLCFSVVIISSYAIDQATNQKITNSIMLGYLYLKNSENITFNNISIKVPYYFWQGRGKDSLNLLRYPHDYSIFIKNTFLSKEALLERTEGLLHTKCYNLVSKGELKIDNENGYFITLSRKSNPSYYIEDLTIPNKSIAINFIGEKKDLVTYREIIKQIKFR